MTDMAAAVRAQLVGFIAAARTTHPLGHVPAIWMRDFADRLERDVLPMLTALHFPPAVLCERCADDTFVDMAKEGQQHCGRCGAPASLPEGVTLKNQTVTGSFTFVGAKPTTTPEPAEAIVYNIQTASREFIIATVREALKNGALPVPRGAARSGK